MHAAYLANVRVGYVEERVNGRWIYQLIFIRPEGGAYLGRADSEDEAKEMLTKCIEHWLDEANLRGQASHDKTKAKEAGSAPRSKTRRGKRTVP
jgi:hypothetical protein